LSAAIWPCATPTRARGARWRTRAAIVSIPVERDLRGGHASCVGHRHEHVDDAIEAFEIDRAWRVQLIQSAHVRPDASRELPGKQARL
jgi:hypothetical protein